MTTETELLKEAIETCRATWELLDTMTTRQYQLGKDKPIRERLVKTIERYEQFIAN